MNTRWLVSFVSCIAFAAVCFFSPTTAVQANEQVSGTFVKAHYDEVEIEKDIFQNVLSSITIKNDAGRIVTLPVDRYTAMSIDTLPVKVDAFKLGMEVEAEVSLRKVKKLSGKTNTPPAVIENDSKAYSGDISYVERDLKGFTVKLNDGRKKNVFSDSDTHFFKNGKRTDISSMREGDRVTIRFSSYDSTYATKVEIMDGGVIIAGLYKGTLHRIDPAARKITMKNETQFVNWHWFTLSPDSNSSYYYTAGTPIYLDDEPVPHNELRKYANHKVYIATVSKHGKEQVERIIIQKKEERTYYEPLKSFSPASKQVTLESSGAFRFHGGSIIIRNGRLVEPEALGAYGTAFIAAAGPLNRQYANIIHISNDALDSPILAGYSIYYGKISNVINYQLQLSAPLQTMQNTWTRQPDKILHFNNETYAVGDFGSKFISFIPQMDMRFKPDHYGYFYVKNNQIIASHLVGKVPSGKLADFFYAGRLSEQRTGKIDVRNVSQWTNGAWAESGQLYNMDIQQATIIKNGEVITPAKLRVNDRLYILAENTVKGRIILVD